MAKRIRVGFINCDLHAYYYAALMEGRYDPVELRKTFQSAFFYHFLQYNDARRISQPTVKGFLPTRFWSEDRERAEGMRHVFNKKGTICDTFEEASDDVDMVFIADCNFDGSDHLKWATPSLQKRVPTFVDKPFAYEIKDAVAIVNLAKRRRVPVLSMSILRSVPEATRFAQRLPEVAQHVFGNGVESVEAMGQTELAYMHLNYGEREDRPSEGVALLCQTGPTCHCAMYVSAYGSDNAIHSGPIGDFVFPKGAAANLELARKMVRTGKSPVPYEDMLENVAVASAARKAQKLGRTVKLSEVWKTGRAV